MASRRKVGTSEAKSRKIVTVTRTATLHFLVFVLGIGPYVAVSGLQSSINIEQSVGTFSLGSAYATSFLSSLFITPLFVRRYGYKYALLVGEAAQLMYIGANFYPVSYVMIIAGVINGIGESMKWVSMTLFNQYFGVKHSAVGSKNKSTYIVRYNALFLVSYYVGQMLGFGSSYVFLRIGKQTYFNAENDNISSNSVYHNTTDFTMTSAAYTFATTSKESIPLESYAYCGSKDCQDPTLTKAHIDHYIPTNKMSLNILLSVFCLIALIGIILHACLLPRANPESLQQFDQHSDDNENLTEVKTRSRESLYEGEQNIQLKCVPELKAIFRHALSVQQLLLLPHMIHTGIFYGYYLSEISRAFTSCILGVEKVGLGLLAFSVCSAASSILSGRILPTAGRCIYAAVLLAIDLSNYAFCYFWKPSENISVVFIILMMCGITDPGWKNVMLSASADYFSSNREIALSVWMLTCSVGLAIGFAWSPLLCVGDKIIIQATLAAFGTVCLGIAESRYRRRQISAAAKRDHRSLEGDQA